MPMLRGLTSLGTIAMLISVASAVSYSVGGPSGGWDMITNIQAWATSQSFVTGDNLVFQYMPSHNVVEVTKADYDNCQVTNPLQSYTDGNTVIPLTSPGKRYFICTTLGHCAQGMKLVVDTLATTALSTLPPGIALAPENSAQASVVGSPLDGPTLFPFIPSVESPVGSSSNSVGSALLASESAPKKVQGLVGFGFVLVMILCNV